MRTFIVGLLVLLSWPAPAQARWLEASGRHFVIYSEQTEAELRSFAENLERFDATLRFQLHRADLDRSPQTRLTVYVLADQGRLDALLGARGVAGIYFGRASGSVAFTSQVSRVPTDGGLDPQTVLFHEYTHHFLFNNFGFGAPLWFSEGYPEFWSTVRFTEDGSVQIGLPAMHRNIELTLARPMSVRELLTLRYPISDGETLAVVYGRGWLLSHYLSFDESRRGQLDAYLRALSEGQSAEQATHVFGDLDQLDRDLRRYFDQRHFTYALVPAAQVPIRPVAIRPLTAGETAMMYVKLHSKRGVDSREANSLIPEARRIAARFPDDARVQVALAEAEHDARNFAESEAAADRALAADPHSVDAAVYRAWAMWGRIAASGDATPAQWQEVRRRLSAANHLDPDAPQPLELFFQSFAAEGIPPTQNAIEGLYTAFELAPEDRDLRLLAGRQLLVAGNAAGARGVLTPLTSDGHSGRLGPRIADVLAVLASDGPAAALARLDAPSTDDGRDRTH